MKIALYGNVCNNMYAIAKALRKASDFDVHLYLPANADFSTLPENDDPELLNNYPHWIHRSTDFNLGSGFCFWRNNIIKELRKYDLVVLSSLALALAPFLDRCKAFFFATGSDLTVLPFRDIHRSVLYEGKRNNLKPHLYEVMQRRGIMRADKILTQPFYPFVNALKKLNVPQSRIAQAYLPIIFDAQKFQCREDARDRIAEDVRRELDRFSFRIFHPSRIVLNTHPYLLETGQCKNNDVLVRAFAEFIGKHGVKDAGLYLIDRSYGLDKGIAQLKRLISELRVEQYVVWLTPENRKGFTRDELVDIYSCCDLIADDYGAGWFGSICVEGSSCSKPVLSYIDEKAMSTIYEWHPFLSSASSEGNSEHIARCYFDREFSRSQGELGRKWVLEYHSQETAGQRYVKEFQRLVKDSWQ